MDKDFEQRIRERAYEIWESEGRSGSPEDHWSRAEQELKDAGVATPEDKIIDQLGDFA